MPSARSAARARPLYNSPHTMRAATLAVLAAFAVLAVAPAAAEIEDALVPYLLRAGCAPAEVATAETCARAKLAAATSTDTCENFAAYSPCWPACFCENPEGYAKLVQAYKPQCAHLPPCGASPHDKSKLREETRLRSLAVRHRALKEARNHALRASKLSALHAAAQQRTEKNSAYEKVWARLQAREKIAKEK